MTFPLRTLLLELSCQTLLCVRRLPGFGLLRCGAGVAHLHLALCEGGRGGGREHLLARPVAVGHAAGHVAVPYPSGFGLGRGEGRHHHHQARKSLESQMGKR